MTTSIDNTLPSMILEAELSVRVLPLALRRQTRYSAYAAQCPTRLVLDRIADKWTVLFIGLLEQRPHRVSELLRGIEGISQKMVTQTLKSLEMDGLVERRAKATVPLTVEYSLSRTTKARQQSA